MDTALLGGGAALLSGSASAQDQNQLDFLGGIWEHENIRLRLPSHLHEKARAMLAARRSKIAGLTSESAIRERGRFVREHLLATLGGLPERTPLNARVVGRLERENYTIEKIVFESQPRFYVTANLYVPKTGKPPYPGVLCALMHEAGGKAEPTTQRMLGSFATQGYVALAWDFVGEGAERSQVYDRDFKRSKLIRQNTEHASVGTQCLLVGDCLARYTVWDGMRALDYLVSRPEVDTDHIGCTGNSGGGGLTAQLAVLDERVTVAAPSCWITTWDAMFNTVGVQDGEQVVFPWISEGLDYGDYLLAFAPKPYLILAVIRDFFPISGARAVLEEAKMIYRGLGAEAKVAKSEVDARHGYHKPNRLATYAWFARWLRGVEENPEESDVEIAAVEELACTESGQVTGETVISLNKKRAEALDPKLPRIGSGSGIAAYRDEVRRRVTMLGRIVFRKGPVPVSGFGTIGRRGYRIEKITYETEPGLLIPALLFVPAGGAARKPAIVYVHGDGKSRDASPGGDIEWFVNQGNIVLSIDPRGMGETRRLGDDRLGGDWAHYFGDYDSAGTAFLMGDSLVGMRAEDILRGVDLLSPRSDVDAAAISGIGKRGGAVPLLYAACVDERLRKVALEGMLVSYRAVAEHPLHRGVYESLIPGVLKHFDLPDLVASLAPRKVLVVNSVDPLGLRLWLPAARKAYSKPLGAGNSIQVSRRGKEDGPETVYADWLA